MTSCGALYQSFKIVSSVASKAAILTSAGHLTLQTGSDRGRYGRHQSYVVVVTSVTSLQTQPLQTLPTGCNLKPETAHNQCVLVLLYAELTLLLLSPLPRSRHTHGVQKGNSTLITARNTRIKGTINNFSKQLKVYNMSPDISFKIPYNAKFTCDF